MTDLLIHQDPSDTGEIPAVDPGQETRNLAAYAKNPPPFTALRRPDATGEFVITGELVGPQPKPRPLPPMPKPKVDDRPLSEGEEVIWDRTWRADAPAAGYVGRHRAPDDLPADVPAGRFAALRAVLATAWARVRRSM
jgi:hypothetical protein